MRKSQPRNRNGRMVRARTIGQSNEMVQRSPFMSKEMTFQVVHTAYNIVVDISTPPTLLSYYLVISAFPAAANFLNSFDQYKIIEGSITFIPQVVTSFIESGTVATLVPTAIYNLGVISTAIDIDDAATPGTESVILNHESAILHGPFNKQVTRTWKPKVAAEVYQTGGFGGYMSTSGWIDSASNNVQHYGLKACVAHGTTTAAALVNMVVYTQIKVLYRKSL